MTKPTMFVAILWGVALASVAGLVGGDRRAVSVEIWLAGFSSWFAIVILLRLLGRVPLFPAKLIPVVGLRAKEAPQEDRRPRELRSMEGLVIRSRDNERTFNQQLQPRLIALARHYLPMRYGVDFDNDLSRVNNILGEASWMVDPSVRSRAPTLDELHSFVDLLNPPEQGTSHDRS